MSCSVCLSLCFIIVTYYKEQAAVLLLWIIHTEKVREVELVLR